MNRLAKNASYSSQPCQTTRTSSETVKTKRKQESLNKRTEVLNCVTNKSEKSRESSNKKVILNLNQPAQDLKISIIRQNENH